MTTSVTRTLPVLGVAAAITTYSACESMPASHALLSADESCVRACLSAALAVVFRKNESGLVRAQSNAQAAGASTQKRLIRRHSSGDHAFLPSRQDRAAIKDSQKNFGVPGHLSQDGEGNRLPTTRGY